MSPKYLQMIVIINVTDDRVISSLDELMADCDN